MERQRVIRSASGFLSGADLQKHIVRSYFMMRVGLGVIGIGFPFLLLLGGLAIGIAAQGSISAYYFATSPDGASMRNWFVGLLFMVAISLGLYQGFSIGEDILLDAAAVFGVGIAIFPTPWPGTQTAMLFGIPVHILCAVTFFLCIAFVCWFYADDTLSLIHNAARRKGLKIVYRTISMLMPASMIVAWVVGKGYGVFWAEAAGIFSFGAYWLVKSYELRTTEADKRAIAGRLEQNYGQVEEINSNTS